MPIREIDGVLYQIDDDSGERTPLEGLVRGDTESEPAWVRPEAPDPWQTAAAQGFIPTALLNENQGPGVAGANAEGLQYINRKYGTNYKNSTEVILASNPGATLESGGIRLPAGQTYLKSNYSYDEPDTSFFGMPGYMAPLALLGGAAAAGAFGGGAAATTAGAGSGLGEGIGANAYFAGAQAPAGGLTLGQLGTGASLASAATTDYSGPEFQGAVPPQSTGPGPTFDAFGNPIGGGGYFPTGSAGAGATAAGGTTALARLLGLGQTGSDILSVGGAVLPGILGYLGAGQQSDAYRDVASQYFNIGAPYRGTLEASYQPGFDLFGQPGYGDAFNRAADVAARSYGARYGNPAGSPTAQAGILGDVWSGSYLPALANYRGQLGQFGGLGLNQSGAASLGGANVAGGGLNAIGYGLQGVLNPQPTLADILKQMGGGSPNYSLSVGGTRI